MTSLSDDRRPPDIRPGARGVADRQPAIAAARRTVEIEIDALRALDRCLAESPLRERFEQAAAVIASSPGRVVVSGMGKSGLVGRKVASTLASTGTPSFFIHPAEASHGDLGMIGPGDIVMAMSWSGETAELSDIISYCRRFGVTLIAVTSRGQSTLAKQATIVLELPVVTEACPNRLAPTSSTMLQAAIGDALAVALIEARGFSADDFRALHPRGNLGAKLLRVGDLMSAGNRIPRVAGDASILSAMLEMSRQRFGITGIVDHGGQLIGAFTDGDLRRGLTLASIDAPVRDHMTPDPMTVSPRLLATEALTIMNARNIMQLFVTDDRDLIGIIHLHDILRAGVV